MLQLSCLLHYKSILFFLKTKTNNLCFFLHVHTHRSHKYTHTHTHLNKHLLVSGACSGHLSVVPLLHLWGSLPSSWHPSQPWPLCRPAASPHGIYLSAGRRESEYWDRREVCLSNNFSVTLVCAHSGCTLTQTHTCLASFALSRAMVAVSSARAAAMLLLARLVFRALISSPSVPRRTIASSRFFSLLKVSDSIWGEHGQAKTVLIPLKKHPCNIGFWVKRYVFILWS